MVRFVSYHGAAVSGAGVRTGCFIPVGKEGEKCVRACIPNVSTNHTLTYLHRTCSAHQ